MGFRGNSRGQQHSRRIFWSANSSHNEGADIYAKQSLSHAFFAHAFIARESIRPVMGTVTVDGVFGWVVSGFALLERLSEFGPTHHSQSASKSAAEICLARNINGGDDSDVGLSQS